MSSITLDKINSKKDKLYELDYMRFIACLAVIIVHITAIGVTDYIYGSFPHVAVLVINRSLKFTTPIFIFLSGVTSFYSYKKREFKYLPFIKKRLEKVLVAYFIWCIIYYAIYIRLGLYTFNIGFFLDSVLHGTVSYHLYFVIIITQMYILGPIFYKILKDSNNRILVLVIFAIITALCAEHLTFKYSDRVFLKYIFFYMLGMYVTLEQEEFVAFVKKNRILIALGYIAASGLYTLASFYNYSFYMYVWFVFSLFSVFFIYYVGLVMKEKLDKVYSFIKVFGQSSYYIYLMHPLVLTLMIMYTDNIGVLSITKRLVIYFVTVIPFTVTSCLVFTVIKNKIKKNKKAAVALSK